jgi:CheY-like chemotaxis protein
MMAIATESSTAVIIALPVQSPTAELNLGIRTRPKNFTKQLDKVWKRETGKMDANRRKSLNSTMQTLSLIFADTNRIFIDTMADFFTEIYRDALTIERVGSARELLALAAELQPNVIIYDMHSIGVNVSRLRESAPRAAIIVLLSISDAKLRRRALDAGVDATIHKGSLYFQFNSIVTDIIGKSWVAQNQVCGRECEDR